MGLSSLLFLASLIVPIVSKIFVLAIKCKQNKKYMVYKYGIVLLFWLRFFLYKGVKLPLNCGHLTSQLMNFNVVNLLPIWALCECEVIKHNCHIFTSPGIQATERKKNPNGSLIQCYIFNSFSNNVYDGTVEIILSGWVGETLSLGVCKDTLLKSPGQGFF